MFFYFCVFFDRIKHSSQIDFSELAPVPLRDVSAITGEELGKPGRRGAGPSLVTQAAPRSFLRGSLFPHAASPGPSVCRGRPRRSAPSPGPLPARRAHPPPSARFMLTARRFRANHFVESLSSRFV